LVTTQKNIKHLMLYMQNFPDAAIMKEVNKVQRGRL
jgi:hypothetical protein